MLERMQGVSVFLRRKQRRCHDQFAHEKLEERHLVFSSLGKDSSGRDQGAANPDSSPDDHRRLAYNGGGVQMSLMPVERDVRVLKDGCGETKSHPPYSASMGKRLSGLVTVTGFDRKDVIFESDKVGTVQWRDSNGEPVAMLVRLKPDVWGFSMKGDEDWQQNLDMYGSLDIS